MFDLKDIPTLETERLILRGWRESDLDAFAAMMADHDVAYFLTGDQHPLDRQGAWRQMAMFVGHWALRGYGLFAVEEKATGRFVGRVGAWQPECWVGFELGWGLAREAWGRGLALEAARAAGDWAFARFGLERLVSVIHNANTRSRRLAQHLGMAGGDVVIHALQPHTVWSISREDWHAPTAAAS